MRSLISGFDFSINKTSDFLGGFLDATYVASIVNSKKYSVNGSTLESECAGRFNSTLGGQACARPVTELKHRATLFWTRDVLSLQLTWRHLSGVDDGDSIFRRFGLTWLCPSSNGRCFNSEEALAEALTATCSFD